MIAILRMLGLLTGFGVTLLIWFIVDNDQVGIYFTSLAIFILLAYLLKFGIDDYALKKSSSLSGSDNNQIIVGIFVRAIISYIILYAVLMICMFIVKDHLMKIYDAAIIDVLERMLKGLFCYQVLFTAGVLLQGQEKYKLSITIVYILPPVVQFFLILVLRVETAFYLANIFVLSYVILSILAVIALLKEFKVWTFSKIILFDAAEIKKSLPYWVISVSSQIQLYAPTIISATYLNHSQIARLSFTMKLCQLSFALLVIINYTFSPKIRKLYIKRQYKKVLSLYKTTILICLVALIGMTFIIYFIFLFASFNSIQKMINIESLFWFLWPSYFISVAFGPIGYLLIMLDKEKEAIKISISISLFLVVSLLLNSYYASFSVVLIIISMALIFGKLLSFLIYVKMNKYL